MTYPAYYPQFPNLGLLFAPLIRFAKSALAVFQDGADDVPVNIEEVRARGATLIDRLFDDEKELKPYDKPPGGGGDDPPPDKKDDDTGDDPPPDKKDDDAGDDPPPDKKDRDFEADDESMARKTARENGRELKDLKTQHADLVVKHTAAEKERDELRQRVQQYEQVTIDPRTTPAYQEVLGEMWRDVDAAIAEELPPAATALSNKFSKYVADYLPTLNMKSDERAAAVAKLKQRIAVELTNPDEPYEDMLEDDRVAADDLARQVLAVIRRNAPRATKLLEIESEVRERAKKGRLASGVREYDEKAKFIKSTIKPVGEMDDKLVAAAPEIPEAILTRMAKDDPAFMAKLTDAKNIVEELLAGAPKPLTESEMDALEEQGIDISDYQKKRMKDYRDRVKTYAPLVVRGLALANLTNKTLTTYAKEHLKAAKRLDELDVLDNLQRKNVTTKTSKELAEAKKKEEAAKADPRSRPLPLDKVFNDD